MPVHSARLVAAAFIAALGAVSAHAQTGAAPEVRASGESSPAGSLLNSRFVVTLGGFVVTSHISGSLSGSANTAEQSVDFDQRFGTDVEQTRLRAEVLWRITPTQHLRFSYFDHDVQRTQTLDQDLFWGNYTLLAGGQVSAETNFRVYELAYEFAFLRRRSYEIVAVAGIHLNDLDLKLAGNAKLVVDTPTGPVEQQPTFTVESNSVSAPLPVLGVRADWAVLPRVYLEAAAQVFAVSYQGIHGNWSDLRADATWMFSDHFGIGVGYSRFATHVDLTKLSFSGRLNFGYQGLLICVKGAF